MSDPVVRARLNQLGQDPEFRRRVAYGRLHYLSESGMLETGQPKESETELGCG